MLSYSALENLREKTGELLEESSNPKVPKDPKQNLMSKIDSLIRSIENLSHKRARIKFEIERQKRSLARKREELKRVQKSQSSKVTIQLESTSDPQPRAETSGEMKRIQNLLSESARILEEI